MFRRTIAPVLLTAFLTSSALAQTVELVKQVDVSIDLAAIQNEQAAVYWTSVADDLENAIVARLTDRLAAEGEDGNKIAIDLNEVELASTFQSAIGIADSRMTGQVSVTSATDNSEFEAYELSIAFEQATVYLPEGADVTALTVNSPEYYRALIEAFADGVVKRLK